MSLQLCELTAKTFVSCGLMGSQICYTHMCVSCGLLSSQDFYTCISAFRVADNQSKLLYTQNCGSCGLIHSQDFIRTQVRFVYSQRRNIYKKKEEEASSLYIAWHVTLNIHHRANACLCMI
jgi:hypothetical protein